jgi:hypothetical protein
MNAISELIKEIKAHANHKAKRFAYSWPLWEPWFPNPNAVPRDLRHYLSRCLFEEPLMSVRTLWTPDEFDAEYKLAGGLADALELGIVPFGADEFDYAYILESGEIHTFEPFSYKSGPIKKPEEWTSLYEFFVDAMQAEQSYSPHYLDEEARQRRNASRTRRPRNNPG